MRPPFHSRFLFDAGELLEFSPIYVDGTLYVMNKNATFFAVDAGNGRVRWKHDQGSLAATAAAYWNGKLYIDHARSRPDHLRARGQRQAASGRGRCPGAPSPRRSSTTARSTSAPRAATSTRSTPRTATTSGTSTPRARSRPASRTTTEPSTWATTPATCTPSTRPSGAIRWDTTDLGVGFGRSGRFYATPAVAYGRVYAGNADGRVYSFEASSGDIAWTHSTGGAVYASPAVADTPGTPPTVYIGSADHNFYALDADSGDTIWTRRRRAASSAARRAWSTTSSTPRTPTTRRPTAGRSTTAHVVYEVDKGQYNPVISDGRRIYLTGYAGITKLTPKEEGAGTGKGGAKQEGGAQARRAAASKKGRRRQQARQGGGKKKQRAPGRRRQEAADTRTGREE